MTEAISSTTFVMAAQLPWLDDTPAADPLAVLDSASLFEAREPRPCAIRKISSLGATIRGELTKAPGDEVAMELATGQRPVGTIDWVAGGEAGIRFKQPIDMVALLNRKLVNQPVERRTMPRVELRCGVGVRWGVNLAMATLRNISASGLQIEGDGLPPRDTFVSLFVEGLNVPASEVVWRKDQLAGIELMEELSWSSLMPWIRETARSGAQ